MHRPFVEPGQRLIRIRRQRFLAAPLRGVEVFEQVAMHETFDRQRERIIRVGIERTLGQVERGAGIARAVGRHAAGGAQDVPVGQPGARRGDALMPLDQVFEHFPGALKLVPVGAVHAVDAAQEQGITFQRRQRLRDGAVHFDLENLRIDAVRDRFDQTALRLEQVFDIAVHALGPDHVGVAGARQLGRHQQLGAERRVAAIDDVGGAEALFNFVQIGGAVAKAAGGQPGDDAQIAAGGEPRDDTVGDQVADRELLCVAAARGKRDHCDGRLHHHAIVRPRPRVARTGRADAVSAHRRVQMLEITLAQIFATGVQTGRQFIAHFGAGHGLAGLRQGDQPRCQVDARAVDVDAVGPCIGDVETRAHQNAFFFRPAAIVDGQQLVNFARRRHRVAHCLKAQQQTVAQALDQLATVARQHHVAHLVHGARPAAHDRGFVDLHQAHRLGHVHHQHDGVLAAHARIRRERAGIGRRRVEGICAHDDGVETVLSSSKLMGFLRFLINIDEAPEWRSLLPATGARAACGDARGQPHRWRNLQHTSVAELLPAKH